MFPTLNRKIKTTLQPYDLVKPTDRPTLSVCPHIPEHLHKPGFDNLVEEDEAVFSVLLQGAKPIELVRDALLGRERGKRKRKPLKSRKFQGVSNRAFRQVPNLTKSLLAMQEVIEIGSLNPSWIRIDHNV